MGDGPAVLGPTDFGIGAEIADQDDLVDAACHVRSPSRQGMLLTVLDGDLSPISFNVVVPFDVSRCSDICVSSSRHSTHPATKPARKRAPPLPPQRVTHNCFACTATIALPSIK
jgi:hypothetical protein